jgi:hypothetical protein
LKKIKAKYKNRLPQKACCFPSSDPSCLFSQELVESSTVKRSKQDEEIKKKNLYKLNDIAKSVLNNGSNEPGVMDRRTAHALDCLFYAQHDKYKTKG